MPKMYTKNSTNQKTFDPAAKIEQGSFNESKGGSNTKGSSLNITTADTGDAAGPVNAAKKINNGEFKSCVIKNPITIPGRIE